MLRENQEALDRLIKKLRPPEKPKATPQRESSFDDNRLLDKMLESQNGDKILRLLNGDWSDYPSQSEADQALCNYLAFWTGNNEAQMDRIYRTTGLMRDKWDKKHFEDGRTYGQATIEKAIAGTSETYSGPTQKGTDNHKKSNKRKPRGVTLNDLKGQYDAKVTWIWRKHIAAALSFIFNGREGDGKTTICLQIAKEMIQLLKGYVVWLATEGAVADTVAKMEEIGLDNPRFVVAQKSDGSFKFDFHLKGDRDELDTLLSDLPKPILAVFIDSIRGMSRYDDNDAGNGDLMHKINAIVCDKYRAGLVYIDHWGKGKKDNLLDRNVGSTAKTSAVRGVLSVLPVSKFKRIIKPAKANISSMGGDLEVIKIGEKIIIQEPKVHSDETLKGKAEEWLINLFAQNSCIRATEVYRMGEDEGFSGSLLKIVKKDLGIQAHRDGEKSAWKWVWPLYRDSCVP